MIGTKISKKTLNNYTEIAKWCNENNATIVERTDYYEVVPVEPYVPSLEDRKALLSSELETIKSAYIGATLLDTDTKDKLADLYKEKVEELKALTERGTN